VRGRQVAAVRDRLRLLVDELGMRALILVVLVVAGDRLPRQRRQEQQAECE
jgi:hypothetical protein